MQLPPLQSGGPVDRPRIFGIGLNKTGTVSFHEALEILGYRSLHWGGPEVHEAVQKALDAGEPLLTHLDPAYDGFSDIGILSRSFELLDHQYPGSRFMLTLRPIDAWLDSRRRHVEKNVERKAAGEYTGTFVVVDEEKWRREWERHLAAVRDYFADRPDFVENDITAGTGWAPFCELLGVDEPEQPFPWGNKYKPFEAGSGQSA